MSHRWSDIQQVLSEQHPARTPAGEGAFWAEFKSRAQGRRQDPPPSPALAAARWAVAAVLMAVACAALFLQPLRSARAYPGNAIHALEVDAAHRAVLILNDSSTQSTILWIVTADGSEAAGGHR